MEQLSKSAIRCGLVLFYLAVAIMMTGLFLIYDVTWNCQSLCGQSLPMYHSQLNLDTIDTSCRTAVCMPQSGEFAGTRWGCP